MIEPNVARQHRGKGYDERRDKRVWREGEREKCRSISVQYMSTSEPVIEAYYQGEGM